MTPRRRGPKRGRGRALEVVDVSVAFGAVKALDGVSMEVFDGEFVGVIGPNGAGKTTLFNVISGFVAPATGRIRLEGRRVTDWSPSARARAGMARTFQNVGLQKEATVGENLCAAQEISTLRRELAAYSGLGERADVRTQVRVDEMVERLDLGDVLDSRVVELSMGSAKLVELACVLLRRPRLLLLDEPSSGLGAEETAKIGQLLRELHEERRLAVLMIEHDMTLATSLSEYVYVLDFGVLLAHGRPDEVRQNPKVIEAYLGREAVRA